MTQRAYLDKLIKELVKKMEITEANNIIADYEEYFQSGLAEGKSEEDLCVEFGNPTALANEIFLEKTENKKSKRYTFKECIKHLAFATMVIFSITLGMFGASDSIPIATFIAVFLLPLSILLWLKIVKLPFFSLTRIFELLCVLPMIVAIITWLTQAGWYCWLQLPVQNIADNILDISPKFIPSFEANLFAGRLIALSAGLLCLLQGYKKRTAIHRSLLFACSGVWFAFYTLNYSIGILSVADRFMNEIYLAIALIAFGIVLSICSFFIVLFLQKREDM